MSLSERERADILAAIIAYQEGRYGTAASILASLVDRAKACDICDGTRVVRRPCADTFACCRMPFDGHAVACPGCAS